MTTKRELLLAESFEKLKNRHYDLGSLVYQKLFEIYPESRRLFKGDLEQQKLKLINVFADYIRVKTKSHFFSPVTKDGGRAIIPGIGALGARHEIEYGVHAEHYGYMREAVLYAVRTLLAEDYTDEIGHAWAEAYDTLADAMQNQAGENPGAFAYARLFSKGSKVGPLVVWSDDQFSVGIEQIDNEHKRLVGLLNELHRALEAGTGQGALGGVLEGLYQYTCYHFAHEEILFERSNYPGYEKHFREHRGLTTKVLEIYEDFQKGSSAVLPEEILEFLKTWLAQHIMGSDREFGQYLLANPNALRPPKPRR
jgi:hemerythrin-like metal-binding protein